MKFVCYDHWDQLPECANQLFAECEQKSVFLSRDWLENITYHSLPNENKLLLVCVIENQRFLAILPMMQCPRGGLNALSTRFTTFFSLLISDRDKKESVFNCLAKGLSQLPINSIQFEPIDSCDTNMNTLQEYLLEHELRGYPYFKFYNWTHKTNNQTFNEYINSRPTVLRNTIQRKRRKLDREQNYEIKLYKDRNIKQALIDYQNVYSNSWKANEYFSDFTPNLIKRMSESEWLRLGILYIDSKPIAAQIWIVVHSTASIYRLVYDEKWKQYSPGSILTEYLMQHVINIDKVSEIDFLTGNESYKHDWMTLRKERIGIRFSKPKTSWYSRKTQLIKNIFFFHDNNSRTT